jgi:S1-C subfamily serine protease
LVAWRAIDDGDDKETTATEPAPVSRDDLARATVRIDADYGSGSGVIIDREKGLIITNAHVAAPKAPGVAINYLEFADEAPDESDLEVSISDGLDQPAEPRFTASVVAFDGYLDVAVLKLEKTLSGTPVDADDLAELSEVELGDADELKSSDPVSLLGYPAAADSAAPTFTEGVVSGWVQDDRLDTVRAWMTSTATSSGGNSGGLAADEQGRMIGIATLGKPDSKGQIVFSGIRPINLALPVIEAARSGQQYTSPYVVPGPASATVDDLSYGTATAPGEVSPGCRPGSSDDRGPLAVSVEYTGFPGGPHTDVAAALYDGSTMTAVSKTTYPAELKPQGCLTVTFDTEVPAGDYELVIGVGGDLKVVYDEVLTFE